MTPLSRAFLHFSTSLKVSVIVSVSTIQSQSRLGLDLLTFPGLGLDLESGPDMGKVSISLSVLKMLVSTSADWQAVAQK